MEEKAKKKGNGGMSSSLKHRFTQMLLGSSCTTTATTATSDAAAAAAAKLVKLSSPPPQAQETPEVHSDCGHDKRLKQHRRNVLDRSASSVAAAAAYGNCFTPRVAPAAQVPLECAARHSIHTSEPLESRTPRVECNRKQERRLAEGAEFRQTFSRDDKKPYPAQSSPSSRTPRNLNHGRSHGEEVAPSKKNASEKKCKANRKETMKKLPSNAYGFSSSSSFHSGSEHGFYSSDEEEDEEEESACTLFSSRSFSSDSSGFYQSSRKKNNNSSKDKRNRISARMKSTRRPQRPPRSAAKTPKHSCDAGGKSRPLVSYFSSKAEKQAEADQANPRVRPAMAAEGLAVVKRSSDPYMDFRSSMVEMIVEKNISSAEDLEDLLQSYLSLNAARHHPAIAEAFFDIWDAIFCCLD